MRDFIESLALDELVTLSEFTNRIMLKIDAGSSPEQIALFISLTEGVIEKQIDQKLEEHAAMHEAFAKLGRAWKTGKPEERKI